MLPRTSSQAFLNGRVLVKVGDITAEAVDAMVNAANSTLMGGGGVDGAIHRRGGPLILEECKKIHRAQYPDGLPAGEAVATCAGLLPAKFVIHTVGPVWSGGKKKESETLGNCYVRSLECAENLGCQTIAFPALSTGVYRFPKDRAAEVSSMAIRDFLRKHSVMKEIRLVFFSSDDAATFVEHHMFDAAP